MDGRDFATNEQAAAALGVSVRHVRRLVGAGQLTSVARGLVARDSLDRYLASADTGRRRTRAWSEHTAWGAIAVLTGAEPSWLGVTQAARVRSVLRDLTEPAELIARVRDRATTRIFTAHSSALPRLQAVIQSADLGRLGIVDAVANNDLDGYISARQFDETVRRLGLRPAVAGNVTLRVTDFDFDVVTRLVSEGPVVAALDAATALEPRIQGVGSRVLAKALEGYR
ncbi:helix-turn-helix domain-containing protein [Nocardia sp. NPDC058705]|uniref:helix-turn-helix domain-containing protein n=1 Tax=Nocardia sp. NPDC058705 TaxID=3346609 RepID=UPI0036A6B0F0